MRMFESSLGSFLHHDEMNMQSRFLRCNLRRVSYLAVVLSIGHWGGLAVWAEDVDIRWSGPMGEDIRANEPGGVRALSVMSAGIAV